MMRTPAKSPRRPLLLTIRFPVDTEQEFVLLHYPDALDGGMFVHTVGVPPVGVGASVALRFQLRDGRDFFGGTGQVVWVQRRPGHEGLGIHFEQLAAESAELHRELLARQRDRSVGQATVGFHERPTRKMARARREPPPLPARRPPQPPPRLCVEPDRPTEDPTATAIVMDPAEALSTR